MSRTVLIDGDILIYLVSGVAQETFEEPSEDDEYIIQRVLFANKTKATSAMEKLIENCKKETKSQNAVIALSDRNANFRKTINPEYKKQRPTVKPLLFEFMRDYLKTAGHKVYMRPTLEADDILGILATSEKIIKGDRVIWSLDKDFKTIPCKFHKVNKKSNDESIIITEEMADWYFMYQTLIGDKVDGYAGCQNVGDKTARKILGEFGEKSLKEMWESVLEAYKKAGQTEEEALLNARMARILRVNDYDFKERKVNLWQPIF